MDNRKFLVFEDLVLLQFLFFRSQKKIYCTLPLLQFKQLLSVFVQTSEKNAHAPSKSPRIDPISFHLATCQYDDRKAKDKGEGLSTW